MTRVAFGEWVFDEGFVGASRADGAAVRFTRQERALLGQLAAHPRRLFKREDLYVATGSRGSDRNVDFAVNRLRAKLGDTGSERRFISTQYGEGYVWIASPREDAGAPALLVIGPVRGATSAGGPASLEPLRAALSDALGRDVRLAADADGAVDGAHLSLEAVLHRAPDRLHAAFVLRREPSRDLVTALRATFEAGIDGAELPGLTQQVCEAVWKALALGPKAAATPLAPPLQVRMHDASVLLDPPGLTWRANGEHLSRLRAEGPVDPSVEIMWAMHLFARSVLSPGPAPLTRAGMTALEDEIEAIVLPQIQAVRDEPLLALAAAKLLLLINRGYADLAEELTTRAFAGSTALAAALPMLGQLAAHRGDLAEALRLYDEALALGEPGSAFELYVLVLKAKAMAAGDNHHAMGPVFERIRQIQPMALMQFGLLFLPPDDEGLARVLAHRLDEIDLDWAQRTVAYSFYRSADLFERPEHVANAMRGPLTHLVRRFGAQVASPELWAELPADLHYLNPALRAAALPEQAIP